MTAGTKVFAPLIKRSILSLIAVFFAGVFFQAFFTNDREHAGEAGLTALGFYLAASIILGIINFVCGGIYNLFFAEGDYKETYLADFRLRGMPFPRRFDSKTINYLDNIANDPTVGIDDRVKAAFFIGHHRAVVSTAGFWGGLTLERAANEAVLRYAAEAPDPD